MNCSAPEMIELFVFNENGMWIVEPTWYFQI